MFLTRSESCPPLSVRGDARNWNARLHDSVESDHTHTSMFRQTLSALRPDMSPIRFKRRRSLTDLDGLALSHQMTEAKRVAPLKRVRSEMATAYAAKATNWDFWLPKFSAFRFDTDVEADDVFSVLPTLAYIEKLREADLVKGDIFKNIVIVAGGGNAAVQTARIKAYVGLMCEDGLIRPFAMEQIVFVRGENNLKQKYPDQGLDVLTPGGRNDILQRDHQRAERNEPQAETGTLLSALDRLSNEFRLDFGNLKHASLERLDFGIKKPDEAIQIGRALFEKQKRARSILYGGAFNTRVDDTEMLAQHYESYDKAQLAQNFISIQDGANHVRGDGTKRSITWENTPIFARMLLDSNTKTGQALRRCVLSWNKRTLLSFCEQASESKSEFIQDLDRRSKHEIAANRLGKLKKSIEAVLEKANNDLGSSGEANDILAEIHRCVEDLSMDAGLKEPKKNATDLGFRVSVIKELAGNINTQMVIADQLTALSAIFPQTFNQARSGKIYFEKGFPKIDQNKKGTVSDLGTVRADGAKDLPNIRKAKIDLLDHTMSAMTKPILNGRVKPQFLNDMFFVQPQTSFSSLDGGGLV